MRSLSLATVLVTGALYLGCTQDFDQFENGGGTGGAASTSTTSTTGNGGSGGGSTTSTSTTSTSTTTSTSSTTSTTSGGGCTTAADCDDQNACTDDTCDAGTCNHADLPNGPNAGANDAPDDCLDPTCVNGAEMTSPDNSEVPADDGNECTVEVCQGGSASHPPAPQGAACAAGTCDGQGACLAGCVTANDCPGVDEFCKQRTCTADVCGWDFTADDTILPAPPNVQGNCHTLRCDGAGNVKDTINNNDTPPSDNNSCTQNTCLNGVPYPPVAAGTNCFNGVCDGMGTCVECLDNGDCNAPETCGGGGTPNQCGCTPADMAVTCAGKCGSVLNNCGMTVNCPGCMAPLTCVMNTCQ